MNFHDLALYGSSAITGVLFVGILIGLSLISK